MIYEERRAEKSLWGQILYRKKKRRLRNFDAEKLQNSKNLRAVIYFVRHFDFGHFRRLNL